MSRIRYLDIDDLNDRLSELEDLEGEYESAKEAYDECASGDSEELDELRAKLDTAESNFSSPEKEELEKLRGLADEIGTHGGKIDVDNGPFIHSDDFEDYARVLAEDIDGSKAFDHWPFTCIDWKQAAEDLQSDYSVITWNGDDYLYRSS